MSDINTKAVTVMYYDNHSLELQHEVQEFAVNHNGLLDIPDSFKQEKSIIAICEGMIDILNTAGDRAFPIQAIA
ncbi:TIGR02922 family protein [Thalassomonas sp. M1454]|uniref:TIGR02922 family protein n=1 Tax=Thalassomonas sp. M1454 TaxID=2594477 RepID=UPI00117CAD52|nr:TIGR02922 family protein [Thalassomonas sp. M1454]TRX53986.1 TIGR02922 family protein [Thalassomonas sp. M1454]